MGRVNTKTANSKLVAPRKSRRRKITIEFLKDYAANEHDGDCESTHYFGINQLLDWRCSLGHSWSATPKSVVSMGSWCPTCAIFRQRIAKLNQVSALASEHEGTCLEVVYISQAEPMHFRCVRDHIWIDTAQSVVSGKWCKACKDEDIRRELLGLKAVF